MSDLEENQEPEAPAEAVDIHDIETLKKLWYLLKDTETSQDVFAIVTLLLDSMPYDWIDTKESWLLIAHQLEEHGETELASLFKLANQKAFQLSLQSQ